MNDLTKKLMCISMRNGINLWLEEERILSLKGFLKNNGKGFVEIGNEMINTADVVGIFEANTLEEVTRRKNGDWKCSFGNWHERGQKCGCKPVEKRYWDKKDQDIDNAYKEIIDEKGNKSMILKSL